MKLRPDTKIVDLAASPLLATLSHGELIAYIRLVAESMSKGRKFRIANRDLFPKEEGKRNAPRVLKSLEKRGLLKLHFDDCNMRTVELI